MDDQAKILKFLVSAEKLADEILSDKREIVLLDKRRNQNREALRDLTKAQQKKCWVTVGSVLVKHNFESTKALLEADQKQLNMDINTLRSNLKVKINSLRDLEMQAPTPGLTLVPLSNKETEALSKSGIL
ncbi:unnamed protein product [Leptosia nina]|uniref:p53 and DNA damage-regulated protein 1 n=1 Tax=Leptosia nina TaxID=320188 RepID=A0AAV1JJ39_9NEOP